MKQYNAQEYRHCWGKMRKSFDNKSNFENKNKNSKVLAGSS